MANFDINDEFLYEYNKPELRERTRNRLQTLLDVGMDLGYNYQFYYKGVISGLWIEWVWGKSDDDFADYIEWVKEKIIENETKN